MPTYQETKRYIQSLADLPTGWHYGQGTPPTKTDIGIMSELLLKAQQLGFNVFEAFPGVDGEIQLAVHDGIDFYSFTIEPDAKFTIAHERNQTQILFQERATFHDAVAKLEDFSFQLWNTPELFTLPNSPRLTASPAIWPSKSHLATQGSPASMSSAQVIQAALSASTSISTTQNLLKAIRLSIGSYQTAPC